jgi:outer membrane protein assembly factor BamA
VTPPVTPEGRRGARLAAVAALGLALLIARPDAILGQEPVPPPGPEPPGEPVPPPANEPPPSSGEQAAPPEAPDRPGADQEAATPAPSSSESAAAVIGQIVVDGNVRVSDSAFFGNLHLKPGDPYDERLIRSEFERLWELDLFDDISVETRRRPGGTVDLIFHVRDRPLIGSVTYLGQKAITETSIQERLQQGKADIRRGQPVDFSLLRRAEALITHMLGEKGYLDARVRARLSQVSHGQQDVTFDIREGGKTKIKAIDFVGNTVFKDAQLRKTLKLTKQAFWLTSWASSKPLYHPAKFDQDAENIRTAYRSRGYLDILIQPEVVEVETAQARKARGDKPKPGSEPQVEEESLPRRVTFDPSALDDLSEEVEEPPPPAPAPEGETEKERAKRIKKEQKARQEAGKGAKRWVYMTVPIQEGRQYRLGTLEVEGNDVFSDREILARFPLRPGMVYNDSIVKLATKRIEDDYGERGYFYVSLDPRLAKHDDLADLTLEITEDRKYYVDRIEFSGNNSTRDQVLRREMRLQEQQLFNVKQMRLGIRKIAQLGYWQVGSDPVVSPEQDTGKVRIEVQGVEASRNEIQVGGGVSGIDGGFFQGSYSTRNFLGRGEIFSAFLQTGQRGSRYALNFTEPWFLGRPWALGFSLFKRQQNYSGFRREGQGGAINIGRLLGTFSRFDVAYGLEDITYVPTAAGFGLPSTARTSSILSVYTFDTRNNFFRPTHGIRLQSSVEYAGGFLGGDYNFVKFRQDGTLYMRGFARRHYAALNASYGYVEPFGDSAFVPQYERYYLGGERSLRMFRTRSVGPVRSDEDVNENGFIDTPEDRNPNGIKDACEDLNGDGVFDANEIDRGNCLLDPSEDTDGDFALDSEDLNKNGILDPGEDLNGNGVLDTEDRNGNGILDGREDRPDGFWTPRCDSDDPNMNGVQDAGEIDRGNCKLDPGEDTNGDGVFGSIFPGGTQYLQLNAEYAVPITDTVEFVLFYDAGNAFDTGQSIRLDDMRVDYGVEMRFFLPVFQAPLRLIYGVIQDPRPGEETSNFIFSIGTTF